MEMQSLASLKKELTWRIQSLVAENEEMKKECAEWKQEAELNDGHLKRHCQERDEALLEVERQKRIAWENADAARVAQLNWDRVNADNAALKSKLTTLRDVTRAALNGASGVIKIMDWRFKDESGGVDMIIKQIADALAHIEQVGEK